MEFKHLINKYVYRIEPRPGGGFIARATDPSVPPLDAATREELREKIQATVIAGLNDEFPGLKLPLTADRKQFAFHVERNGQGGFDIHTSSDPTASPVAAATRDEVESHFAEKLIALVGKHFAPELAQALGAPGATGDIKVVVKSTGFTLRAGGNSEAAVQPLGLSTAADAEAGLARDRSSAAQPLSVPSADAAASKTRFSDRNPASAYSTDDGPISRSPITAGNDRRSVVVRFLLALVIVAAVIYFFFLRRH
jgi:hypothetical protein